MAPAFLSNGLPTPDHEPAGFDLGYPLAGCGSKQAWDSHEIHGLQRKMSFTATDIPEVSKLDSRSCTSHSELVSRVVESMQRSGGCLIQNLISTEALSGMENEIRPYLNQVKQADPSREAFVPSNTRMVTGLLSKSRTYATKIIGNRIFQDVSSFFLTSTMTNSWHGEHARSSVSKPQLSTTITFSVPPGTPAQGLHRDDDIYHTWHPACTKHHQGRDNMVCFFVAGSDCTTENGATRIIPGSHLWDFARPPPTEAETGDIFQAEMRPGDVFMMLGGVYHGAGQNRTMDQERLVYAAFATRGFLRQEENQYLANDLEKIRELPAHIQRFAGFGVSKPYMGWVDLEDPVVNILGGKPDEEEKDFW